MALNENPAMSPSSSVHCGQYDATYATIGCTLRKAFVDETILSDKCEPARIALRFVLFLSRVPEEILRTCHRLSTLACPGIRLKTATRDF